MRRSVAERPGPAPPPRHRGLGASSSACVASCDCDGEMVANSLEPERRAVENPAAVKSCSSRAMQVRSATLSEAHLGSGVSSCRTRGRYADTPMPATDWRKSADTKAALVCRRKVSGSMSSRLKDGIRGDHHWFAPCFQSVASRRQRVVQATRRSLPASSSSKPREVRKRIRSIGSRVPHSSRLVESGGERVA